MGTLLSRGSKNLLMTLVKKKSFLPSTAPISTGQLLIYFLKFMISTVNYLNNTSFYILKHTQRSREKDGDRWSYREMENQPIYSPTDGQKE